MSRDNAYLLDILKAARLATSYVSGVDRARFLADSQAQSAVVYQVMIIGEATKRLSEPFRKSHPEIPWADMAGMRDVLIHDYGDVNPEQVWHTVTVSIPLLISQVDPLTQGK